MGLQGPRSRQPQRSVQPCVHRSQPLAACTHPPTPSEWLAPGRLAPSPVRQPCASAAPPAESPQSFRLCMTWTPEPPTSGYQGPGATMLRYKRARAFERQTLTPVPTPGCSDHLVHPASHGLWQISIKSLSIRVQKPYRASHTKRFQPLTASQASCEDTSGSSQSAKMRAVKTATKRGGKQQSASGPAMAQALKRGRPSP